MLHLFWSLSDGRFDKLKEIQNYFGGFKRNYNKQERWNFIGL